MAKYRKKPVVVEAFKWTGDQHQTEDPDWIVEAMQKPWGDNGSARIIRPKCMLLLEIVTLEGMYYARRGDYIIKGADGGIRPCNPSIFEQTYEALEE